MSAVPAETVSIEEAQASYQEFLTAIAGGSDVLALQGAVEGLLSTVSELCDRDKEHKDFPAFHVLRNSLDALNTAYTEALKDDETREHKVQSEATLLQACQGSNLKAWFAYIETKFKGSNVKFCFDPEADFSDSCISPDLGLSEDLDPHTADTIKAMLENFLSNAARYSQADTQIQVSIVRNPEGFIELSVANTAKAISEAASGEHLTSGNGNRACGKKLDPLGFRLSVDIAEAAGGTTVSRCVFPSLTAYQENKRAEDERVAKVKAEGEDSRVKYQVDPKWCVLVDDETAQRMLLKRAYEKKLKALGYATFNYVDGDKALDDLIASRPCDNSGERFLPRLLMADTNLGGLSGVEIARQMLKKVGHKMLVVRMTGSSVHKIQVDDECPGAWLIAKTNDRNFCARVVGALKAVSTLGTASAPVEHDEAADHGGTTDRGVGTAPAVPEEPAPAPASALTVSPAEMLAREDSLAADMLAGTPSTTPTHRIIPSAESTPVRPAAGSPTTSLVLAAGDLRRLSGEGSFGDGLPLKPVPKSRGVADEPSMVRAS